jgi:hypothetical protein
MKRRLRSSAIIAAISVPALGLGLGLGLGLSLGLGGAASAAPQAASTAVSHFSERTVVVNCQGRPQVRPGDFTLACGDGNDYLTGLSWTSWTAGLASATGVQEENDCIPYCAAGHFHGYPVDVVFWGSAALKSDPGTQRYTKVTLLYPGVRPNTYDGRRWVKGPSAVTVTLWSAPS